MSNPRLPSVSIVIINYRTYGELSGCLAALLPRADEDLEAIVIDHGPDREALPRLETAFPHVRFVGVGANQGFAAGINRGAAIARGRYLFLVNPDSVVEREVCRALAGWLDAHPDTGAVGPRVLNEDGTLQPSARRFPDLTTAFGGRTSWLTRAFPGNPFSRRNLVANGALREPTDIDWVSGACMMVRRQAFDQVGGMDEGFFLYWEDADFCRRLHRAGWRTVYYPLASVVHAGGRGSRHVAPAALIAFHRSAGRYFRKHAGQTGRLLAPAVSAGLHLRLALKLGALQLRRLASVLRRRPRDRTRA